MTDPLDIDELDEDTAEWLTDQLHGIEMDAIENRDVHPVNFAFFLEAYLSQTKKQIVQTFADLGVPVEIAASMIGADFEVTAVSRDDIPEDLAQQLDEMVEAEAPDGAGMIDADELDPELAEQIVELIEQDDEDYRPRGFQ